MSNFYKGCMGLDWIIYVVGYFWVGFKVVYMGESVFCQEIWLCIVVVLLMFWLAKIWEQVVLLLGLLLIVFIVELLNLVIEVVVDCVFFECYELFKCVKDIVSVVVLMVLVLVGGIWVVVVWQYLY